MSTANLKPPPTIHRAATLLKSGQTVGHAAVKVVKRTSGASSEPATERIQKPGDEFKLGLVVPNSIEDIYKPEGKDEQNKKSMKLYHQFQSFFNMVHCISKKSDDDIEQIRDHVTFFNKELGIKDSSADDTRPGFSSALTHIIEKPLRLELDRPLSKSHEAQLKDYKSLVPEDDATRKLMHKPKTPEHSSTLVSALYTAAYYADFFFSV